MIIPAVGWEKIHIDEDRFLTKENGLIMVDFGGIAKGLTVDLLVENLSNLGFSNLYVEWGGEIKTLGEHPQGRKWKVFISRFEDTKVDNAVAIVEMDNLALATSGDYLQKWVVDGTEYFHIFNLKTMQPLRITQVSPGSATIAYSSCAIADGLATAALTFDTVEEARTWLEKLKPNSPSSATGC